MWTLYIKFSFTAKVLGGIFSRVISWEMIEELLRNIIIFQIGF